MDRGDLIQEFKSKEISYYEKYGVNPKTLSISREAYECLLEAHNRDAYCNPTDIKPTQQFMGLPYTIDCIQKENILFDRPWIGSLPALPLGCNAKADNLSCAPKSLQELKHTR